MKSQEKLQQEFEALIELMLETGIAAQETQISYSIRINGRYPHTRFVITNDHKNIRLHIDEHTVQLVEANKNLYDHRDNLFDGSNVGNYNVILRNKNGEINSANLNRLKKIVKQEIDKANNDNFGICAYHQAVAAMNRINFYVRATACHKILTVMEKIHHRKTIEVEDIKDLNNALKTVKKSAAANKNKALKMQFQLLFTYIKTFFTFVGLQIRHQDVKLKEMIKDKTQLDKNIIAENKTDAAFKLAACSSVGLFRKVHKKSVDNRIKTENAAEKQRKKEEVSRYEESAREREGLTRTFVHK